MEYAFSLYNQSAVQGTSMALTRFLKGCKQPPVFVFIGTDLAIGDSLGPVAGTMTQDLVSKPDCFIYGTLRSPMTAKEVGYIRNFIKETHPKSKIIVVDAAVGDAGDIGLIKIRNQPLCPGQGVNKSLGSLGDISILGIISEKSVFNYSLMNLTRFSLVYQMASIIAHGISDAICSLYLNNSNYTT